MNPLDLSGSWTKDGIGYVQVNFIEEHTHLQILTRLSQPPETSRLIGCCRALWSNKALGTVEGAQLTALQPI